MPKGRMKKRGTIVEIALELTGEDLELLEDYLDNNCISYYVEPQMVPPYKSLDEVETQCEDK